MRGRLCCKLTHFIKREEKLLEELWLREDRENRLGSSYTCMCTGKSWKEKKAAVYGAAREIKRGRERDAWEAVSVLEGNMVKWCLSCLSVCILSDSLQSLRQQAGPAGRRFGSTQSLISIFFLFTTTSTIVCSPAIQSPPFLHNKPLNFRYQK